MASADVLPAAELRQRHPAAAAAAEPAATTTCSSTLTTVDGKVNLEELLRTLPLEFFERSMSKAVTTILWSIGTLTLAYFGLALLPWFLVPIGWIAVGTAMTGLATVAYDCAQKGFFTSNFLNDLVGSLFGMALLLPYESVKAQYANVAESVSQRWTAAIASSRHFWWVASPWQWLSANVSALSPSMLSSRMALNLVGVYVFVSLLFPLMAYNLGVWGVFKYYLIPLAVYHFWMSTLLKANYSSLAAASSSAGAATGGGVADAGDVLHFFRYPKWVELLSNDANYSVSVLRKRAVELNQRIMPSYHVREAVSRLQQKLASTVSAPAATSPTANANANANAEGTAKHGFFWQLVTGHQSVGETVQAARDLLSEVYWPTALFLLVTPVLGVWGTWRATFHWETWLLGFLLYCFGGMGITAGYHRLFSHRSYDASRPLQLLLVIAGSSTFEGSVFDWCSDHRSHHRYTDTEYDPYNVRAGFMYAHWGWLLFKRDPKTLGRSDISDLQADPVLRAQHKYYPLFCFGLGWFLPMFVAGLGWGDWWGGFFVAGLLWKTFLMHCTFCINSLAHFVGDATFADERTPRDWWFTSLLTFGEGYHNFHHEFPYDYRNGYHWYAFDPSKWLVWALSFVGQTFNLKRFPTELIEKGKIAMREKRVAEDRARFHWGPAVAALPEMSVDEVLMDRGMHCKIVVIDGIVHDVTKFIDQHPGGRGMLAAYLGRDATAAFSGTVYAHSLAARHLLHTLRIARVKPETAAAAAAADSADAAAAASVLSSTPATKEELEQEAAFEAAH